MKNRQWRWYVCVVFSQVAIMFSGVPIAMGDAISRPHISYLSIAGHDSLWRDLLIPVCWENPSPEDEVQRTWVQDAIEDSWEKVSLVNFTGWGKCTSTSAGIRIRTSFNGKAESESDDWPHVKKLGDNLNGIEEGMVLNFATHSSEFQAKSLAVHEFGHALGFAHEHNRRDRFDCETQPQGTNPTFYITSYDPQSVMNYCSPLNLLSATRLSTLDVAGIRAVYGPFTDVIPAKFDIVTTINIEDGEFGAPNEHGSRDFQDTFVLTDRVTSDEKRITFCVGKEVRVEVGLRASLLPGTPFLQLASTANMYEGESCATDDHESHDHASNELGMGSVPHEARLVLHNTDIVDDHAEIRIRVKPDIERVVQKAMQEGCRECQDEANRTQFVGGNPFASILTVIL